MDKRIMNHSNSSQQESEVRKGPWTMEEDLILINYIANHGEGVWNNLARSAGLNRTGKSCRLRWLNYLRPDVRRGNITPEEQLLIMELHSRWGNRWSKIARHLPGRTDNEIKNYWRTRIQKKMKNGDSFEFQNAVSNDEMSTSTSQANSMEIDQDNGHIETNVAHMDNYTHDNHHHYYNQEHISANNDGNNGSMQPHQFSAESNDFWSVDDFWSMQSLNND